MTDLTGDFPNCLGSPSLDCLENAQKLGFGPAIKHFLATKPTAEVAMHVVLQVFQKLANLFGLTVKHSCSCNEYATYQSVVESSDLPFEEADYIELSIHQHPGRKKRIEGYLLFAKSKVTLTDMLAVMMKEALHTWCHNAAFVEDGFQYDTLILGLYGDSLFRVEYVTKSTHVHPDGFHIVMGCDCVVGDMRCTKPYKLWTSLSHMDASEQTLGALEVMLGAFDCAEHVGSIESMRECLQHMGKSAAKAFDSDFQSFVESAIFKHILSKPPAHWMPEQRLRWWIINACFRPFGKLGYSQ